MWERRRRERTEGVDKKRKKDWIREEILRKWQRGWEGGRTGREAYDIIKKVRMEKTELSWKGRQLVSGHGKFGTYIKRFTEGEEGIRCRCGGENTVRGTSGRSVKKRGF